MGGAEKETSARCAYASTPCKTMPTVVRCVQREARWRGRKAISCRARWGMLILKSLAAGDLHGYGIARWVEDVTKRSLAIEEGSLYPALRRLEDKRWVASRWEISDTNRRVRVYALTRAGRAQLETEASVWMDFARAVTLVLRSEPSLACCLLYT